MSKMIHARRRMVTEDDRYGGYRKRDFSRDSAQSRAFGSDTRNRSNDQARSHSYDHGMTETQEPYIEVGEPVSYSGRDYSTDIGLVPAAKFAKSKPTQDQLMPRIQDPAEERLQQKRREIAQKTAKPQAAQPVQPTKASTSTKVALVVYITAVLLLTAAVVGMGIAINNATDRIDSLESVRSGMVQTLTAQDYELQMLSNPDYLAGLALGQDMEKIDSYTEIEMIELSEPMTYTPPSNWFDAFCDWMSGLFQ